MTEAADSREQLMQGLREQLCRYKIPVDIWTEKDSALVCGDASVFMAFGKPVVALHGRPVPLTGATIRIVLALNKGRTEKKDLESILEITDHRLGQKYSAYPLAQSRQTAIDAVTFECRMIESILLSLRKVDAVLSVLEPIWEDLLQESVEWPGMPEKDSVCTS